MKSEECEILGPVAKIRGHKKRHGHNNEFWTLTWNQRGPRMVGYIIGKLSISNSNRIAQSNNLASQNFANASAKNVSLF